MPNDNINNQTSEKKQGNLHKPDEQHVASQDSLKEISGEEE